MMSARMEVETKGWYVRFAGNLSTLLRMCLMSYGIKEGEKFQANTFVLFISDDGSCSDGTPENLPLAQAISQMAADP
ncbi:uncharacterized protein LOC111318293 isoform X2 [Durio zibethinus]|uniref:Uncharacterized protein LOC111318293 isoform X2 n=1 Tax=Durio zibethinus TaxID=66656 RepID=A0A6P6BI90_DURZI|nr:uncharacterized protein LOC111318293 isoform X2 [Durio zibethinus]